MPEINFLKFIHSFIHIILWNLTAWTTCVNRMMEVSSKHLPVSFFERVYALRTLTMGSSSDGYLRLIQQIYKTFHLAKLPPHILQSSKCLPPFVLLRYYWKRTLCIQKHSTLTNSDKALRKLTVAWLEVLRNPDVS